MKNNRNMQVTLKGLTEAEARRMQRAIADNPEFNSAPRNRAIKVCVEIMPEVAK